MGRSLAMNQFLGHQTRTGGGSQFLRGWRKRTPAQVDVALHRHAPIVALWQHGLPRIFVQKDEKRNTETRRVFGGTFNCLEDESVLLKQYRRDRNTGERVSPPVLCPVCRLMESLRELYNDGTLGFCDTIFRWEGDDPSETQELTLGGMLNLYSNKELSDEEKDAMAEARISMKEAWKENSWSKCNYLFCVVDLEEPDAGIQLAVETTALGDAVKECLHAQMTSLGEEDGNPVLNPYAIRWEHHAKAKEFSKRYKAIAMPRLELTPQVLELIDGDPPDIDNVIKPGNITKLRAELESRCVLDDPSVIPWDDIFGPAERAGYGTPSNDDDEEEVEEKVEKKLDKMASGGRRKKKAEPEPEPEPEEDEEAEEAEEAEPAKASRRRKKVEPEPEEDDEEDDDEEDEDDGLAKFVEGEPCDECGAPMPKGTLVCEKCGAEYEDDEEPEPPPKKASKKATSKKATSKKATSKTGGKIPF